MTSTRLGRQSGTIADRRSTPDVAGEKAPPVSLADKDGRDGNRITVWPGLDTGRQPLLACRAESGRGEAVVIIGGWRGPGWRIVTGDREQARQVRDWIGSAVSRHDCPVDPADVALAVSELYANAVMHGPPGSRVLAGYCLWSAGARIVVCDGGGPTAPQVRRAESLAEGGRGLQVIDALAVQWGSFRLPGAQAVWCDFGQPLRVPDADAWAWLRRVLDAFPLGDSVPFRSAARPALAGAR